MIRLIASDLDGTLIQYGKTELNPALFPLIRRLTKRGILFTAATGRQYTCTQRLFAPVKDDIAYICENGALCIYKGKVAFERPLKRPLGLQILRTVREKEDCEILLSGRYVSYIEPNSTRFIDHLRYVVKNDIEIVPDLAQVTEPFYKISVCNFNGIENCDRYFIDRFSDVANVVTSGNIWLDFMDPQANKGTALADFSRTLGFTAAECAAFGDHYNDVEMLRFAGESYAMETAQPGIAPLCRHTCETVEAELERLLLRGA